MQTTNSNPAQTTTPVMALVNLLVARYQPLQVYQFAQLAQQERFHSLFAQPSQRETATHHLFVLTAGNARMEHELQEFANANFVGGRVVVLAHGPETLKHCLAQTHYFFTLVLNQGTLLYSANGFLQQEKAATPKPQRRLEQARSHWKHRGKMARGFLLAAERALDEGHGPVFVFLLHQAIEQYCIGLIWVFMGYKSDIHNLKRLVYICSSFSKLPQQHFMGNYINDAHFSIIIRSYGQARYQEDFNLEGASLYRLFDLALAFEQMADQLCEEKFSELEAELTSDVTINEMARTA